MTTLYENAVPIVNLPFLYINGAVLSNDATTPNTVLDLSAGICRDSTNTYDLNIGNFNGQTNTSATANVSTTINCAVTGLNGLDTGTLGASKMYYVYVVADPVSGNPTGAVVSLAVPSVGPIMPFGYSAFRHVGYAATNSSSHFLLFYQSGNNNARRLTYDAPQATAITAGAATSYTAIDLSALIPTIPVNQVVQIAFNYNANAAGDTLKLQPVNGTGDAVTVTAGTAGGTAHSTGNVEVIAQIVAAGTKPEINYKVSSGSDSVAIDVAGFNFYI